MGDHGDDAAGGHEPAADLVRALAATADQVRQLGGLTGQAWGASEAELRELVAAGAAVRAGLEAAWLRLVKALDDRGDGRSAARQFLMDTVRLSPYQAAADVAAAHTLDPDTGTLPAVGAALAQGDITRAHADAAVRTARDLPRALGTKVVDEATGLTGMGVADAFLAEQARTDSPRTVEWLGEQLLSRLAPDREHRHDRDAVLRRTAGRAWDSTGMLRGKFQMDGAAGAGFVTVWDHLSAPAPSRPAVNESGQEVMLPDERSHGMRMVDALTAMGRLAAAHLGLAGCDLQDQDDDGRGATDGRGAADGLAYPDARNEPGSVTITATTEQVAATADLADDPSLPMPAGVGLAHQHTGRRGPISSWLLSRLACDAVLQRVLLAPTGAVLDLGRRVRLATPSQKRALAARDGGCVIPTCAAPPEICDTHHIVAWSSGGPTDLDNLASLCPRHHTAVHAGHWLLSVRDGTVWAAPPAWIDPKRRPLRNTTHQTARAAQALGEQLRLLLDRSPRGQDTGDP